MNNITCTRCMGSNFFTLCKKCDKEKINLIMSKNTMIKAAPDMYEALRELLECHDEDIGMEEYPDGDSVGWENNVGEAPIEMSLTFGMLRRARSALRKATGESTDAPGA